MLKNCLELMFQRNSLHFICKSKYPRRIFENNKHKGGFKMTVSLLQAIYVSIDIFSLVYDNIMLQDYYSTV